MENPVYAVEKLKKLLLIILTLKFMLNLFSKETWQKELYVKLN
jgi:hypothetical protein